MTRAGDVAYRFRWILLAVGAVLFAAGATWVFAAAAVENVWGLTGTPALVYVFENDAWMYLSECACFLGLVLLTQWLFLRPRGTWTVSLREEGRPLLAASIGAAFCAMLLSVGLVATLLEIPDWWNGYVTDDDVGYRWPVYATMLAMWCVWACVFFVYWRAGDRYTRLTRMIRALLAGTVLELLVAAPVHALCYDRDRECHCVRGSYTGLVFGATALLWVFGPGVVLLFLRERWRRGRLLRQCPACGHDLRGSATTVCPACGGAVPPGA